MIVNYILILFSFIVLGMQFFMCKWSMKYKDAMHPTSWPDYWKKTDLIKSAAGIFEIILV